MNYLAIIQKRKKTLQNSAIISIFLSGFIPLFIMYKITLIDDQINNIRKGLIDANSPTYEFLIQHKEFLIDSVGVSMLIFFCVCGIGYNTLKNNK